MTRADARLFVARALADAGLRDVRVAPDVTAARYDRFDVWRTRSQVANGGSVVLFVDRRDSAAVYVSDSAADGGPLLTEAQLDRLRRFRYDPARERVDRSLRAPAAAALALIVVVGVALVLVNRAQRSTS